MKKLTPIVFHQVLEHHHPTIEKVPALRRPDTKTTRLQINVTKLMEKAPIFSARFSINIEIK